MNIPTPSERCICGGDTFYLATRGSIHGSGDVNLMFKVSTALARAHWTCPTCYATVVVFHNPNSHIPEGT